MPVKTSASLQRLGDKLPGAVAESAAPTKKRRHLAPAKSTSATDTVQGIDDDEDDTRTSTPKNSDSFLHYGGVRSVTGCSSASYVLLLFMYFAYVCWNVAVMIRRS